MTSPEATWGLDAVARWMRTPTEPLACPDCLDPDRLEPILAQNRLLPLFQSIPLILPEGDAWNRFRKHLESAYQQSLLQGLQQLKSGQALMEILSKAGIGCRAVRGPFFAEDVYGDPALRLSSDVDILVSLKDRRRAWKVCRDAGYKSLDWECPSWPIDRHRIHWRLQGQGDPVVCELHWAVEPLYGAMTLDYEALVTHGTPTQQFLALCLHAGEHVFEQLGEVVRCCSPQARCPSPEEAVGHGMLFRWIDVAMFLRKYGAGLDWAELDRHARDRRVGESLVVCLAGVREWFGIALPGEADSLLVRWEASAMSQRSSGLRRRLEQWWETRAYRRGRLQTSMPDVLYYLVPHTSFFSPSRGVPLMLKRLRHGLAAGASLSRGLISYSCFVFITSLRRVARGGATAMLMSLLACVASGHEFNDDFGDTAAMSQPIPVGSNVAGRIEIDVDEDWFSFQSSYATNKEIVVTVSTGTLWNSTAGLAAPDGVVSLVSTDSVASVTSRVTWIHIGPPSTYFIRVAGFASFTTGTYTIAVAEQPFGDDDNDGLPDSWELACFGNTNQPATGVSGDFDGDGSSNLDEFRAGTHPTNENSRLSVTGFSATNGPSSLSWSAMPYRYYAVEACANLAGGQWDSLGTVTNLDALGTLRFDDSTDPLPPVRFYRVRCL